MIISLMLTSAIMIVIQLNNARSEYIRPCHANLATLINVDL